MSTEDEIRERARRKGRRLSISAEATGSSPDVHVIWSPVRPPNLEEKKSLRKWLSNHFLFSSIKTDEAWDGILNSMERKEIKQVGEVVIQQHSLETDFLYVVENGIFDVWVNDEKVDFIYSEPGSCFGELALMYACPRMATVRCIQTPAILWMLDRATFKRMLVKDQMNEGREEFLSKLRKNWLLKSTLSEMELEKVGDVMNLEIIESKGTQVIQENESDPSKMKFYIVLEGTLRVTKEGNYRRILYPGDYFGERGLLFPSSNKRTATVTTESNLVRLGSLDLSNFERLLKKPCFNAFVDQIRNGYVQTLLHFTVGMEKFDTNITYLEQRHFETCADYYSFMKLSMSTNEEGYFWITEENRYSTGIPSLFGRYFPNVESYVAYLSASPQLMTTSSPSQDQEIKKQTAAFQVVKKRGRRGSVSGETISSPTSTLNRRRSAERTAEPGSTDNDVYSTLTNKLQVDLRNHFLFSDLNLEELSQVVKEMVPKSIVQNEYVITQNDENADYFYVVAKGEFVIEKDGVRLEGITYGPGASFGELAILYSCPRAASVICASSSGIVFALNREIFRNVVICNRITKRKRHETFLKERIKFFSTWSTDAISRVSDVMEELTFEKGAVVIREGDSYSSMMKMYFIESGEVEVCVNGEFIRSISSGGFFGERAIIERTRRSGTVITKSDTLKCLALDVPAFERLMGPLKDVLRGQFDEYVDHVKDNKQSPKSFVTPKGWFKVGNEVFRTNVWQLNGKSFQNMVEFSEASKRNFKPRPSSRQQKEEANGEQFFKVENARFITKVPSLIGKEFKSVEDFILEIGKQYL